MSQKQSPAIAWLLERLLLLDTDPEVVATKSEEEIDADLRVSGIDPEPIIARVMDTLKERSARSVTSGAEDTSDAAPTVGHAKEAAKEFISLGERVYSLKKVDQQARLYLVPELDPLELYDFVDAARGGKQFSAGIVTDARTCVLTPNNFADALGQPLELRLHARSGRSTKSTPRYTLFLRYRQGDLTVEFLTGKKGELLMQFPERS